MKFTIDVQPFTGQVFELLAQDDMTWAEAGELESALGLSLVELDDMDSGRRLRRSTRVLSGFLWISVRRLRPDASYADVANTPQRAVTWLQDEAPDPTEGSATAPTTETPDSATSQPSPTTSEYDPGNGSS